MQDIPYGYCHCGCGEKTSIAQMTSRREKVRKGEPKRFRPGHAARIRPKVPVLDRIMRHTEKTADGCWLWIGCQDDKGYGIIRIDGRNRLVHRIAYMELVGPISTGLVIDHLCDTPLCVNPDHLEAVLNGVNNLRGNSPWALNAKKSHCKQGHPFSGDNVRLMPGGGRACRECGKAATRRYRERKSSEK